MFKFFKNKMKGKNKKGFIIIMDVIIAIVLLNFISIIFFSSVSFFYNKLKIIRDEFFTEILLTECAEVVQSFRYGEWDKNNEAGWDNFKLRYPTGMYKLKFDEITNNWDAIPVLTNDGSGLHIQDLKTIKALNLENGLSTGGVEVIQIDNNSPLNVAFRLLHIDNNSPNQAIIKCMVKYNFNSKIEDDDEGKAYKELKFILMNYL